MKRNILNIKDMEVFIDEDFSGGDHKHNYNAFAYHISQFYDVVDLGEDGNPHLYNENLEVMYTSIENKYLWEIRMPLYTDNFVYGADNNPVKKIKSEDKIGLSVAYCDNDGGNDRESFMGSVDIEGLDKNSSWRDASVFGTLVLKGSNPATNTSMSKKTNGNSMIPFYPNPFTDKLYFKIDKMTDANVRIYTIEGKQIQKVQI
jgi:hypothetical protein